MIWSFAGAEHNVNTKLIIFLLTYSIDADEKYKSNCQRTVTLQVYKYFQLKGRLYFSLKLLNSISIKDETWFNVTVQ